ncbi:hypothetical protein COLO4_04332 [Corchorus olitorius]|uniref:Uncharacterized protein n=1 Tax=Corchorus olitorius TaxID=93759 RepID=A0A1R3KUG8_9ROSI|nr:hypothetical protein COLO4_04332 [Corchorus olitorius]
MSSDLQIPPSDELELQRVYFESVWFYSRGSVNQENGNQMGRERIREEDGDVEK